MKVTLLLACRIVGSLLNVPGQGPSCSGPHCWRDWQNSQMSTLLPHYTELTVETWKCPLTPHLVTPEKVLCHLASRVDSWRSGLFPDRPFNLNWTVYLEHKLHNSSVGQSAWVSATHCLQCAQSWLYVSLGARPGVSLSASQKCDDLHLRVEMGVSGSHREVIRWPL